MATNKDYGTTMQVWPSGDVLTYRGDLHGPAVLVQVKREGSARWAKATKAEVRTLRINERAKMYRDQYIWCCDSSLVSDLIEVSQDSGKIEGFSYEDIENLYTDVSDFDADQCREYASDHGLDLPSLRVLSDEDTANRRDGTDDSDLDDAREVCREHAQENPAEIYEWWRVDPWLCARLKDIGECVIDNGYGCWWGRCATGQGLIMDGTLQRIAEGQEREGD